MLYEYPNHCHVRPIKPIYSQGTCLYMNLFLLLGVTLTRVETISRLAFLLPRQVSVDISDLIKSIMLPVILFRPLHQIISFIVLWAKPIIHSFSKSCSHRTYKNP